MTFDVSASKDYATIQELASEWRVSIPHIHNLISRRELRAHKIGARYIISRADAQNFLERNATARAAA
jgi:excisionase family DNA binding protein